LQGSTTLPKDPEMRGSDVNWEGAAYLGVTEQPDLRGTARPAPSNCERA